MSIVVSLEQLLDYSDHERRRWNAWIAENPARLQIPFQPGGRFPTVWHLFDHVFLVERRHLCRLEGGTPPEATGAAMGDWDELMEYADLVRADFRKYVTDVSEANGAEMMTFTLKTGPLTVSRKKLAAHVLLHEARHLAQLAYAVRLAGHEPPGDHDYLFCPDS